MSTPMTTKESEVDVSGWKPIGTAPLGEVVDTIIMDADGERNHQPLKATQRDPNCRVMWWFPDGSMYVYYAPTHWKPLTDPALTQGA